MSALKRLWLSWLLPAVLTAAALGATAALPIVIPRDTPEPREGFFFLFIPAVMLAAWYGHRIGGMVATVSALLVINLFLLSPYNSLKVDDPGNALLLLSFGIVCAIIALVTADHRRGVAERERALQEAETARRDAEVSSRLKDQFLATLSHELRTPLNAVLGWTRMLATGQVDPAKVPAALASIERNAHAQKQLVDDLLDVSAIVSGRLRMSPRTISLDEVVRGAIDSVALSLEGRHQHLEQHVEPVHIVGDADRLQQVMWNLLSNAVKFTPEGGSIRVRLERVDGAARITVRDTGRGIRPEFLPYVFEPFRQADASITRTSGGLGLGLALVRHLVEAHGGSVTVASDGPRKGTTFVVMLPTHGPATHATLPAMNAATDAPSNAVANATASPPAADSARESAVRSGA